MSGDLTFLSLCSGAGGLDVGLEMAGWTPLAQVEIDRDCCQTLEAINAEYSRPARVINAGIETIDPRELRLSLGLARGELRLVAGGPPCQPFTTHGLRQTLSDKRASSVFPSYLGYIREFEPETLVIENVDGFLSAALEHVSLVERERRPLTRREMKGSFLEWVLLELDKLGYSVSWGVVEAADYGVPQYRQRVILIGTRRSVPCYLPEATVPWARTVREGLSGVSDPGPIQPLSERKRAIYALIPPGGNWRSLPVDVQRQTMGRAFHATGGKSGWWRRLAWELPSPTILGMPDHSSTGLIHPDEVRCLGLNECAALQSFPASIVFQGTPRSQYQQVGNAVPPLLGAAIGEALVAHLEAAPSAMPPSPDWRSESANRRIGTHGWLLRKGNRAVVSMNAKVRADHVWALEDGQFTVNAVGRPAGSDRRNQGGLRRSA
jgi:DNA (cytosine-5)-methyltransferase 1